MSNNLASEQLSMQSIQTGQLDHIGNNHQSLQMGSMKPVIDEPVLQTISNNQTGVGPGSTDVPLEHTSMSNNQAQAVVPLSSDHVSPKLSTSNMQMGQTAPQPYNLVQGQFLLPNRQLGGMAAGFNNVGLEQSSILSKRKSPMGPTSNNSLTQKMLAPNKRVAQMEHRPWLQQTPAPGKLPVQVQSATNPSGPQRAQPASKRPASSKNGPQLTTQRNQTGHVQTSTKGQSESSESVRSKLRQSLAEALALVIQQQGKSSSAEKNAKSEASCAPGQSKEATQHPGQSSGVADVSLHSSEEPKESLTTTQDSAVLNLRNGQSSAQETSANGVADDLTQPLMNNDGLGTQPGAIFRDDDVSFSDSFFAKDDLLQGNGLSWVLEPVMGVEEKKTFDTSDKQAGLDDVSAGREFQNPQTLASEIEVELFKLFGGVNKKYKEKGRSLLFNLKDRNNPALRERVMSGEIPPGRLCSMSAEELASEELSQWRMAKAEELAQMVVLPDSDINMRRLVKKTHKGEFQVEVDEQDSVSIDVAIGANTETQMRPNLKKKESSSLKHDQVEDKANVAADKDNLEEQPVSCTITIPSSEGNDLMQGLMVDDELKDVDFLPPIVSLDEFMESLNSEPPFEDLPAESGKITSNSDKGDSPAGSDSKSGDPADASAHKNENIDLASKKSDTDAKQVDSRVQSEPKPPAAESRGNYVWEGVLQLSVSAAAPVIGIFKSGEKTSAKEWSRLIEIKGRVRLDAFDKFLQQLPMSRSRALMVVKFLCKEGAAESERSSLTEVADSYVLDERVGFAEPAPGVELYLCPPHSKTREMILKVLPKDQVDEFNAIDNGLIGVIVWRKPQIASTVSPNSASLHKHSSKKQQFTTRRHHEKDTNVNSNVTQKHPLSHGGPSPYLNTKPDDNDDDDLPPGFGPPAARDEDDLPEFNFTSGRGTPGSQYSNPVLARGLGTSYNLQSQTPNRPVDQMRELVHRYGQPKSGLSPGNWQRGTKPWDDDDDDDMPEWQPENVQRLNGGIQQSLQRAQIGHQAPRLSVAPTGNTQMMSLQPQANAVHGQQASSWQGTWMAPPAYPSNGARGNPAAAVGQQGMVWRRDAPQSRGF